MTTHAARPPPSRHAEAATRSLHNHCFASLACGQLRASHVRIIRLEVVKLPKNDHAKDSTHGSTHLAETVALAYASAAKFSPLLESLLRVQGAQRGFALAAGVFIAVRFPPLLPQLR